MAREDAERPVDAGSEDGETAVTGGFPSDSEGKSPEAAGRDDSAEVVESDFAALVDDVKRERDEYLELAQRARADFENYRKRAARETSEAERRGKVSIAREVVPALDNLERALQASGVDFDVVEDPAEPASREVSAHEALARGMQLVLRELVATLERAGVERYDPVGEPFDPAWHEALATRADPQAQPGTVIETLEKGYRLDGQVIRPARVVVGE